MPPKRNVSQRKLTQRRHRRSRPGQIIRVPFYWKTTIATGSTTKNITASDLNLDLTRPLKIISLNCEYRAFPDCESQLQIMLTADGQEGTVSRPHLISSLPRRMSIRMPRVMDFGLYGDQGVLAQMILSGSNGGPTFTICGHCTISYREANVPRPISLLSPDAIHLEATFECISLSDTSIRESGSPGKSGCEFAKPEPKTS